MANVDPFTNEIEEIAKEAEVVLNWQFVRQTREALLADDPKGIVIWTKKLFGIE